MLIWTRLVQTWAVWQALSGQLLIAGLQSRGEVAVDTLSRHPGVQGDRRVGVGGDRVGLERPPVPVGPRPQPVPELADHQPPQLRRRQLRRPAQLGPPSGLSQIRWLFDREGLQFGHDTQRALPPRRTPCGPGRAAARPGDTVVAGMPSSSVWGATHTLRPPGDVRSTEMLDHSTWPGRGREEVSAGQRHKKRPQ